jgi:hypothetical protein
MKEIVNNTPTVAYIACDLDDGETLDAYRKRVCVKRRRGLRRLVRAGHVS